MESVTIRLEPATREQLREVRRIDGIAINEQIRRAIEAWLGTRAKRPIGPVEDTTRSS